METFDVLNMGNISNFPLEHSNCYLFIFLILGPLYKSEKNSSDYRVYGTQNDRLEPTVSTQKWVSKNMH